MNPKSPRKKVWVLLRWSLFHACWLIVLTFFGLRVPHTTDEEMILIKWTSGWKRMYLKRERPDPARFLFVNIAWEKEAIPRTDANGFMIGTDVITNRKKLASFFDLLNQKPENHKFVILDVRFEEKFSRADLAKIGAPIPAQFDSLPVYDSLLQASLARTRNYIVSYHADEQGKLKLPVFPFNAGLSDYETTDEGTVVKFSSLHFDTVKTTPLKLYQAVHNKSFKRGYLFDTMDGWPVLNSFILDHRVILHPWEFADNDYYHHAYLSEILEMPPALVSELTRDRIIILGDFEDRDIHDTIYGPIAGPIILVNAFLAYENHDNRITPGFIFLLLGGYTFISYRCFSQTNFLENILINRLPFPEDVKKVLAGVVDYLLILIILSVVSYLLFNIHLTILLIAIYMQVMEWTIAFFTRKRKLANSTRTAKIINTLNPKSE